MGGTDVREREAGELGGTGGCVGKVVDGGQTFAMMIV